MGFKFRGFSDFQSKREKLVSVKNEKKLLPTAKFQIMIREI